MGSADRDVEGVLSRAQWDTLGERESTVQRPSERKQTPDAGGGGEPPAGNDQDPGGTGPAAPDPVPRRVLTLTNAQRIAVECNRELRTQREALYLTALSLVGTRHDFAPQLDAVLSFLLADSDGATGTSDVGLAAGVSQVLPQGGRLSLSGLTNFQTDSFSSGVQVSLIQPLLRGAGNEVAWEPLTQAERSLVYAVREFELFRQSFSIDVAGRFYDLVQQKQSVENELRNLEKLEFTRKKAEALFAVGRGKELDVLRARRDELSSQNRKLEAEERYLAALENFRIFLGLPPTEQIDVESEDPDFVAIHYDEDSAVEVALANRLDLVSRIEQVEDAERAVRISRNALLPDLELGLNYVLASGAQDDFTEQRLEEGAWSASLRLDLPIDRLRERNAQRSSLIALARARRELEEFRQQLAVGIADAFRELERLQKSLEIQQQLIEDQQRNVRVAELLFERGENDNRDVVEALQALVDAQNALISEKVAYAIARLELIKDLGLLFIGPDGMWIEP
jgi:outer membrane protein TolC